MPITKLKIVKQKYGDDRCYDSHVLDLTGRIALKLVEHFGVITGELCGEDSAGRAKFDAMTPPRVVERACRIAELFVATANDRGWLVPVPGFDDIAPVASD